jgi:anti-sigma factor RsiW
MICCREMIELLLDFDSGTLPPDRHDHCQKHLVQCPACHAYLESYRITIRLTRQLPHAPLPDGLSAKLHAWLAANPPHSTGEP